MNYDEQCLLDEFSKPKDGKQIPLARALSNPTPTNSQSYARRGFHLLFLSVISRFE